MMTMPFQKYSAYAPVDLEQRTWPSKTITKAPIWCAVDLRDGNQSLINPMNLERKLKMYHLLLEIGVKEIEIGFPSASQIEYDFMRHLVEENLIPDDVTIQVLVQAREPLIRKTFDAIRGCRRAIVHLYNSTSVAQRRDVFKMEREDIIKLAVEGTQLVKALTKEIPETDVGLEYSPESFTGTELDFAKEICDAVVSAWDPKAGEKVILNLPSTVEMSTPNIYADQIEWMHKNLARRDDIILSLHTHNDRGTGVAATELGLLAGADRVEGTLFGNGERTGNVDIVTLALNMMTQAVDPVLDFSNLPKVCEVAETCNQLPIPYRHPYAGELVFTAFSGSHQDAIKKGMEAYSENQRTFWDVPYLPIDPKDIGRDYEAIIRVNSQSGKSGVAYLMEKEFGFRLPKALQIEFSKIVQKTADETAQEINTKQIWTIFEAAYLKKNTPYALQEFRYNFSGEKTVEGEDLCRCAAKILADGKEVEMTGQGNGPINAFVQAIKQTFSIDFSLTSYEEHALAKGSGAEAASYISIETPEGKAHFGVGVDTNTSKASIKAVVSALNRSLDDKSS
ncbi:MAG: 2-isopropylmalate synthase [Alphaproteobacteria bacterium]